jgi:cell division protein YceG involved in septum cleavage
MTIKRSLLIVFVIIILLLMSCFGKPDNNSQSIIIDKTTQEILNGVYTINPNWTTQEMSLSWGKAKVMVNSSVVIDLGDEEPYIRCEDGKYKIESVKKKSDIKYELQLLFQKNEVPLIVNLSEKNIWFEKNIFTYEYGIESLYFKIDGPEFNA